MDVIPSTQVVCTTRAVIRTHSALGFELELIQNAGANKKKRTSHAIHCRPEIGSPFRVELSNTGREKNSQINRPAMRKARWYKGETGAARFMPKLSQVQMGFVCARSHGRTE